MMASCHVEVSWGECIGLSSVNDYSKTTGAKYLGWSYDYDKSEIQDVHKTGGTPTSTSGLGQSATSSTGVPDTNYYKRQQYYVSIYNISIVSRL